VLVDSESVKRSRLVASAFAMTIRCPFEQDRAQAGGRGRDICGGSELNAVMAHRFGSDNQIASSFQLEHLVGFVTVSRDARFAAAFNRKDRVRFRRQQ